MRKPGGRTREEGGSKRSKSQATDVTSAVAFSRAPAGEVTSYYFVFS